MDEPKVTVICLAYNQAPYIRDALEGFVRQQTIFPFEVVVHDDASTDGTADIIREYVQRYPTLFKPIFQKENQYSKGVPIGPAYCFPLVRGQYVALCEGDDYWTDPLKLQLQADALDANPGTDLCAHCARVTKNGKPHGFLAPRLKDGLIPVEEVVKGIPFATASLLCRKEIYLELTPMRRVAFNDLALLLQGSARGGLLYISRCMSVYRLQRPGSWTASHRGARKKEVRIRERAQVEAFDRYTEGRFHDAVQWRLAKIRTDDILTDRRYWELFSPRNLPLTIQRLGRTFLRRFRNLYFQWRSSM